MIKIKVWGDITEKTTSIVESAVASLINEEEPVLVVINSNGGTINDAIAIYNLLANLPNPLTTIIIGKCYSAATLLFNCGKKRYITKDSEYMIHQPLITMASFYNLSDLKRQEKHLAKTLRLLKKYFFNKDIQIPKEKLDYAFKEGKDLYLSYKECLKYNIATDIFTNWSELYKKENINSADEKIYLFEISDVLVKDEEE